MEKVSVAPIPMPASQQVNIEHTQKTDEQEYDAVVSPGHVHGVGFSDGRGFDLTGVPVWSGSEAGVAEEVVAVSRSASGLLTEDAVTELRMGQMKKTEFMRQLRARITEVLEPVLARVGQTTEGCPYINYWLGLYQQKDAEHIERTVKKYAPDSVYAETAEKYIDLIVERALRAAEIWALTGKLRGIPDGVPVTLPGGGGRGVVQAKPKSGGVKKVDDPEAIREELGVGEPLAGDIRGRMEPAFGMSFSHVRAHTDTRAAELSRRVNARAFTVGNHVAFGQGEYQPGTMLGDALIAHELAHTIQQEGSDHSVGKMEAGGSGYEMLEQDADHAAAGVVGRLWGGSKGIARRTVHTLRTGLRLQRCSDPPRPPVSAPRAPGAVSTTIPVLQNPQWTLVANPMAEQVGGCNLKFQQGTTPGMHFAGNVHTPAGCTGRVYFVQYTHPDRVFVNCPGSTPEGSCARPGWGLDTQWPYAFGSNYEVSGEEDRRFEMQDSPGHRNISNPDTRLTKLCFNDEFVAYLVYERGDHTLTSLGWFQWGFNALAVRGNGGCPPSSTATDCTGWQVTGAGRRIGENLTSGAVHPTVPLNRSTAPVFMLPRDCPVTECREPAAGP